MAEPQPGYEQGAGTPEQLPKGAATQANENTNVVEPQPLDVNLEPPPDAPSPDPELAAPEDYQPQYQPADEDGLFLTGPTTRPGEAVSAGATAAPQRQKVPPELLRGLPDIVAAAAAPGASNNLRQLAAYLVREATL